ncbi:3-oxoacyl-reductase [Rhizodiscina lignyota]|uniref:3-oxoacyl-reductase n=1 Tax=Rhizodiscina lignyota TaxID=1504668 RepID=A0A9P4MA71_9PEZI|nr:3-oxoacyl-reductase [Rhizodiscina lignyota]
MPTAVVTGANSGIGHAFAQILVGEGYDVFAADVNIGDKIKSLGSKAAFQLDVASESSIKQFAEQLQGQTVDLLLNIAGIMVGPEKDNLESIDMQACEKTFRVNTFGPLLLTQALLPNLLKSKSPRIGMMSSRVGSIADNSSGGNYAYRASKTALNQFCKNLSIELKDKNVVVVIMHPGFVNTNLLQRGGGPRNPETVEPDEAASKLWRVLMSKGIEDTGRFWHREGYELPW